MGPCVPCGALCSSGSVRIGPTASENNEVKDAEMLQVTQNIELKDVKTLC